MAKNIESLQAAQREALKVQNDIQDAISAEKREMNDEEKAQYNAATAKFETAAREITALNQAVEAAKLSREVVVDNSKAFRENVMQIINGGAQREITFAQFSNTAFNTKVSADAEGKDVKDILPTLEKGLIYNAVGLTMQTGVTNKLVWPYATNNVEAVERTEKATAADTDISFSEIHTAPSEHGIMIKLTNEAIDNTAFDIYSFVQNQLTKAEQRYINKKMFAPAYFTGLKGPFTLASAAATSLTAIDGTWKAILAKIAGIASKGYDMSSFAFVCPARTKALLEATPKANGQGGFVCENGRIAGYPVFITEYAGYYQRDSTHQAFDTQEYPLAMGPWSYLALCQHGKSRLVVDPTTLAEYNEVRFILHNTYSITDLSKRGNDSAFDIVKLNDCSANGVVVKEVQGTVKTKEQD